MAVFVPFRAMRPRPADAALIAAVPYDVVSVDEARVLAADNPLSFLRVSRPELELENGADLHGAEVYQRAVRNFERLKATALVLEDEPAAYFYRLRHGTHEQTGLAGCFSIDEYERGVIKKHERTRPDKEDDRTRHMMALGAQTGPVFLTYCAMKTIDERAAAVAQTPPLFDFEASDGVHHTIWRVTGSNRDALVAACAMIPALYIADGHHRAASAARARREIRDRAMPRHSLGDNADSTTFLAVAFPHDQVRILPYNRIVKDLAGLDAAAFVKAVGERFEVGPGPATPEGPGTISLYFGGSWRTLRPRTRPDESDRIGSLDVSVLQSGVLAPVLGIVDVTTDKRIDFVGGARGTAELERLVDSGNAAAAFSLYPVSVADLMAVADSGAIMPPKSTWFEPKLRDGLLVHMI
jgi:uncharacterized protein (DUF1015 family)